LIKDDVLILLKNTDEYVSGQYICDKLGVSRNAVWKAVRKLKEEGYVISGVNNKGYRLEINSDILNTKEIEEALFDNTFVDRVIFVDSVDSTNRLAKEYDDMNIEAESIRKSKKTILFVADEQTSGRGRRGRTWNSPKGSGIWMSFLLKPNIETYKAAMITLTAALAVANAIKTTTGLDAFIKWPNDIVVNSKKVCGILTEMSADIDGIKNVICGIGINANITEWPNELKDTACSLKSESGVVCIRKNLIAKTVENFEIYYKIFLKDGSLKNIRLEYESMLANKSREVVVLDTNGQYTGIANGITDTGELCVLKNDGSLVFVVSGEVSVRGVYGYV